MKKRKTRIVPTTLVTYCVIQEHVPLVISMCQLTATVVKRNNVYLVMFQNVPNSTVKTYVSSNLIAQFTHATNSAMRDPANHAVSLS